MVNHPNRSRRGFTATLGGYSLRPQSIPVATIREGRAWAESYGDTADWCTICDHLGRVVATHRRDTSRDGMRWFRAAF